MMSPALQLVPPSALAVPRYRFGSTSTVSIRGVSYVPVADDEHGHVLRRVDDPLVVEGLTHEQIHACVEDGVFEEDPAGLSQARTALTLAEPVRRLGDLPLKERHKILFREHMCRGLLRMQEKGDASRSDKSMQSAIETIYADYVAEEIRRQTVDGRCGTSVTLLTRPSPTTLRKWLRRYERFGYETLALRPGYSASGNTVPRLAGVERAVLRRFASRYASLRRPTQASLLIEMKAFVERINAFRRSRGLAPMRCPGKTALANAIAAMDPFHLVAAREGVDAARRRFVIVKGGLDVLAPLERVEMDEHLLPVQTLLADLGVWEILNGAQREVLKRSRVWISTAIDTRTRCFLALRIISTPCAAAAIATLEMSVSDKNDIARDAGCSTPWDMYGGIDTVVPDAGSAYISEAFTTCVADLGSELLRTPVKTPWLRGRQERPYRTIHNGLLAMFDGRSFENVVVKGDYASEANATLDVEKLGKLCVRYIVDVYHNTPHAGLGGQTPRNAWLELRKRFGVRLPPSATERRHIFGTLLERRITNSGIRFMGLFYQSPELQKLRGGKIRQDVQIRVDPLDLGSISVDTPVGLVTVPCRRPGMDGTTLETWVTAATQLRRRFASEADAAEPIVLQAIRDVRAAVEGARRRAGIASPVLDWSDYSRIEKQIFTGFERIEAETDDVLAATSAEDILPSVTPDDEPDIPEEPARPVPDPENQTRDATSSRNGWADDDDRLED